MEEEKKKVGRPPLFTNAEQIREKAEAYFKECEGEPLIVDGTAILDRYGEPVIIGRKPLTITGLALALGFISRQSLLNYQEKDEFFDTITWAKSVVEQYAETRLFDKDGANGAKFSLSNNFSNWNEKQSIDANINSDVNINIELSDD